jgi:hypothetical protein
MTQDENRGRRLPADDDPLDGEPFLAAAIEAMPDPLPERDLWPGIQARIGRVRQPRSVTFTLPQLALAATLVIAVTGATSWLVLRPAVGSEPAEPSIRAVAEPVDDAREDVARANFADAAFDAAVADLERILNDERDRLDPRTVIVIERNLQAIDEAIRQSRAALDKDPANPYLNSHLADARRRKLDLLRRAAALSSGGG